MSKSIGKILRCIVLGFLTGIMMVFFVSACGSTSEDISYESRDTPAADSCNVVQHASGETCVPKNPQRIATLVPTALSNAIILGIQPIGSTHSPIEDTGNDAEKFVFPEFLKGRTEGIEPLGQIVQPSLEKMTLLKPDLILSWQVVHSGVYSSLSQIAPTVLYDWQGTRAWRGYFDFMAKLLNREEEAEAAWRDYYERVEELKVALGNRYTDKTISFVYFCCDGFGSQAPESFMGSILEDIGLLRPPSQSKKSPPYGEIRFSEEEISKADGDVIFIASYTKSDQEYLETITEKPLWKQLKAVQQNHVYVVDAWTWRGGNLLAAHAIIDDLYKYLFNTPTADA